MLKISRYKILGDEITVIERCVTSFIRLPFCRTCDVFLIRGSFFVISRTLGRSTATREGRHDECRRYFSVHVLFQFVQFVDTSAFLTWGNKAESQVGHLGRNFVWN